MQRGHPKLLNLFQLDVVHDVCERLHVEERDHMRGVSVCKLSDVLHLIVCVQYVFVRLCACEFVHMHGMCDCHPAL